MHLVIDISSARLRGALFEGDQMVDAFAYSAAMTDDLLKRLEGRNLEKTLIASAEAEIAARLQKILPGSPQMVEPADFGSIWKEKSQEPLSSGRIANIYGALYHFPSNDCVIIDLGSQMRCDYITSQGRYWGGMVVPLQASAEKPADTLGAEQSSGLYFGMLGAAERIAAELRALSMSPSSVMVIATGEITISEVLADDLTDFVDCVDPYLAMKGLNEILKERK